MEWLLARSTVIGVAVVGGLFSVVAMMLQRQPKRARLARQLNFTSYFIMGTSMLLFVLAGLRGGNG
jgi:predicted membrane channel-forming protein YqfA (hemolysin III family)